MAVILQDFIVHKIFHVPCEYCLTTSQYEKILHYNHMHKVMGLYGGHIIMDQY